jgi:hypothetical protein
MRLVLHAALAATLLLPCVGCTPELGTCDPAAAVSVAYDEATGMPAYAGQALVIASCGNGAFCHGAEARGRDRYGVPTGLELDVRLAAIDGAVDEAEVVRLRHGRFHVVQHARAILASVEAGTMPPDGAAGAEALDGAPRFVRIDEQEGAVPLPAVSTPEGRAILRNWLACGAPVVERPVPRMDGAPAEVVPALVLPPVEPTWASIFGDVLETRGCAAARCHGGTEAGFRVTDAAGTYAALVGAAASGEDCDGMGTLVVPGSPDASLFLAKLSAHRGAMVCGDPMPIGGIPLRAEDLDAIRTWITNGAPRD